MEPKHERNISIKIGDRSYEMKADSPEKEARIRKSAEMLNKMIVSYQSRYIGRDMIDILSFVAANQCISNLILKAGIDNSNREIDELNEKIEGYLRNIEN